VGHCLDELRLGDGELPRRPLCADPFERRSDEGREDLRRIGARSGRRLDDTPRTGLVAGEEPGLESSS